MPITTQDLNTLATCSDLAQLRQEFKSLLDEHRQRILEDLRSLIHGTPKTPAFVTVQQFAKLYAQLPGQRRVCDETIRNWIKNGSIKAEQNAERGRWLIPHSELQRKMNDALDQNAAEG